MVVLVAIIAIVVQVVAVRAVAIWARRALHGGRVRGIAEGELPRELVVHHDGRAMSPVMKVSTSSVRLGIQGGAGLTARFPATQLAHMVQVTSGAVVHDRPSLTATVVRGVGRIYLRSGVVPSWKIHLRAVLPARSVCADLINGEDGHGLMLSCLLRCGELRSGGLIKAGECFLPLSTGAPKHPMRKSK